MKRILSKTTLVGGIVAAVWLVFLEPVKQRSADAQGISIGIGGRHYSGFGQGYYGGYGQGYGGGRHGHGYAGDYRGTYRYSGYGNGPYGYGATGVYVVPGYIDHGHSTYFRGRRHSSNYYGRVYSPYGYGGY